MATGGRFRFQKGDYLAIALVAALAVATFLCYLPGRQTPAATVEIYHEGALVQTLPLDAAQELTLSYRYSNTVTIQDGKVAITQSDCPGEDCVHSGWIHSTGRSIVCLPNELEVRVTGAEDDVDFVVR